jgi:DNA-binding winged helix-turn-helix (wHTH) protein
MARSFVTFGRFILDTGHFQLFAESNRVHLEGRAMQLLMLLVEHAGEIVTREQIADRLWGKDVFVDSEQGINTAIRKVRVALSDETKRPYFIQTVVGRGYRFLEQPTRRDEATPSWVGTGDPNAWKPEDTVLGLS